MPATRRDQTADEARIRELRRQIAAGTYLTGEKIDVVVERLVRVLQRQAAIRAAG